MNRQLAHIFDDSACLTRKQMADYISGAMSREECHAVEVHLGSCPFCSEAVDGLLAAGKEDATALLGSLNTGFLKEHMQAADAQAANHHPAPPAAKTAAPKPATPKPAAPGQAEHHHHHSRKKNSRRLLFQVVAVAAGLLLCIGLFWYMDASLYRNDNDNNIAGSLVVQEDSNHAADAPLNTGNTEQQTIVTNPDAQKITTLDAGSSRQQPTAAAVSDSLARKPVYVAENDALQPRQTAADSIMPAQPAKQLQTSSDRLMYANSFTPSGNTYKWNDEDDKHREDSNTETKTAHQPTSNGQELAVATPQAKFQDRTSNPVSISGARSEGTSYTVDGIQVTGNDKKKMAKAKEKAAAPADPMQAGNEAYDKKNYSEALQHFKSQTNHDNKRLRHEAMLMTAQCYVQLGKNDKAKYWLEKLIEEGGAKKGAAKSLLKKITP